MADIKIKLIKSLIGSKKDQIATAESLGLRKIGQETIQPDNAQTKGKAEGMVRGKVKLQAKGIKVKKLEQEKVCVLVLKEVKCLYRGVSLKEVLTTYLQRK